MKRIMILACMICIYVSMPALAEEPEAMTAGEYAYYSESFNARDTKSPIK